jgi:MFS family permease
VRAARVAVTATFAANGALFGSFYSRVPALQEGAGLSDGTLGVGLFALALAALFAHPLTGALVARIGSPAAVRIGGAVYGAALFVPALAGGLPLFVVGAVLVGTGAGLLDVSMNVAGAEVERRSPRRMFSSLHAAFSFGGMTGAALGGLVAGADVPVEAHLLAAGVLGAAIVLTATRWMLPGAGHAGPAFARPTRALAAVGVIAFCALLAEGSVSDWSAIYIDREMAASAVVAAAGLTAFQFCMGVGRLSADPLAERFGPQSVVRAGGALGVAGMLLTLLGGSAATAIAGFALLGLALAGTFPLALIVSAERAGEAGAPAAIAAISTAGYTGLLLGPALIGFVSEATSLPVALAGIVALCALLGVFGGTLRPRQPAR